MKPNSDKTVETIRERVEKGYLTGGPTAIKFSLETAIEGLNVLLILLDQRDAETARLLNELALMQRSMSA